MCCRSDKAPSILHSTDWNTRDGFVLSGELPGTNRKAKYYSMTRAGQKLLEAELENWGRISTAIPLVL
jgi:DNA-binding PadR family transcriptional regulator